MMAHREFVSLIHKSTKRDYQARVTQRDKADVAEMAVKFDYDYWDGRRETGHGGHKDCRRSGKGGDAVGAAYRIKPGQRGPYCRAGQRFLFPTFPEGAPRVQGQG